MPITSMNCFGQSGVDIGQKRLPMPPAMIMICMSLKLFIILLPLSLLKEIFFLKSSLNGLYTPFGSPICGGQKPSLPLKKAPPFSPSLSSLRDERM